MSKIAIVYWSGTGNTEIMANKIAEGAKISGNDVTIYRCGDLNAEDVVKFDIVALGCPSYGVEVLEESEFEPMYESYKPYLKGKKVALFGSYDWGDGTYMVNWQEDCKNNGLELISEGLLVQNTPDEEGENKCVEFGKLLV